MIAVNRLLRLPVPVITIVILVLILVVPVTIDFFIGIFISIVLLSSILLLLSWIGLIFYLTYRNENILWCFLYVFLIMFSTVILDYCWSMYHFYQLIVTQ